MTKLNNTFQSQFTNNSIAVALFNGVNDAIVLPEKTDEISWLEFINDPVINEHEILTDKNEGTGFTTASFKTIEDDDVETKTDFNNQIVVRRTANNIKQYHALIVDVDGGMTIDEAKERFKDNEYLGYTSFNHCTKKVKNDDGEVTFIEFDYTNHKFRLVFLISDAVSPDEFRSRKDALLSYFKGADKSTFAISRLFYTASCPAYFKAEARVWHNKGETLDILSFDENTVITKTEKQDKPVEKFNLAVREAVKNGLKQIGAVEHDPYYKIAASMSNAGMTFQDFEEVSEFLKPNHVGDIDYLLERWTHSSKLTDISPGFVINLLKQYDIKIHQKKPAKKSTETKLLELEIKSLEQQVATLTDADDEDSCDLIDTLNKQLEEKREKLKTSETVSVNSFNDDLIDLFERRAIYYVVTEGLIYLYYGDFESFDLTLNRYGKQNAKTFFASHVEFNLDDIFEKEFRFEILDKSNALITLNTFNWGAKYKKVIEFLHNAFAKIQQENIQHLIIDIRENGGGDDAIWIDGILPFIADKKWRTGSNFKVKILEGRADEGETVGDVLEGDNRFREIDESVQKFTGDVSVLISDFTYSSSILFANVIQDHQFGQLVGEATGGKSGQTGGTQAINLANSKLKVVSPFFYLERPKGGNNFNPVVPDVVINYDKTIPVQLVNKLINQRNLKAGSVK